MSGAKTSRINVFVLSDKFETELVLVLAATSNTVNSVNWPIQKTQTYFADYKYVVHR